MVIGMLVQKTAVIRLAGAAACLHRPTVGLAVPRAGNDTASLQAHIGWHYLSNAVSFVFYGITCLMRLVEVAALFATIEENVC